MGVQKIQGRITTVLLFLKILFIFREREGRERGRETSMCERHMDRLPPTGPQLGPGPQPRHVPRLGIEPATLWFTGQHSIHSATPATATTVFFKVKTKLETNNWSKQ